MLSKNAIFGLDVAAVLYRSRIAVLVGLSVLLGLFCARLVWLIIDPAGAVSETRPLTRFDVPVGQSGIEATDLSILTRANPFAARAQSAGEDIPDAPVTSLNLTLKGVRSSDIESLSSAIIITPDNESDVFRPGDEIIERVVLERVLSDRVILNKNGELESLLLDGRQEEFSVLTRPDAQTTNPQRDAPPSLSTTQPATPTVNAVALLSAITLSPQADAGNLTGYLLMPRGDERTMREYGFEPGDILIEFDGDSVGNFGPSDINDKLNSADQISLSVRRDEHIVPLTLMLDNKRNGP